VALPRVPTGREFNITDDAGALKRQSISADRSAGVNVTCLTASDLMLLETLEQQLSSNISVSLLAEIERELLRLRAELSVEDWRCFCAEFPNRRLFEILRMGTLTINRLRKPTSNCPSDVLDFVMADSFPARTSLAPSPAHLMSAWEYSLPASRSVRARKVYFAREIAETIRTAVQPRILILGGGRLREADDAIQSAPLHHAQFVCLEQTSAERESDGRKWNGFSSDRRGFNPAGTSSGTAAHYWKAACPHALEIEEGIWSDLRRLSETMGRFDLIYSPSWLDSTDDSQALVWVGAAVEMLRTSGRLLAANFAPGARDAGWMEACWNWHPYYRSEEELAHLAMELKCASISGHAVFRDESGASAFLEIHAL
jgi:hypothetical protein